MELTCAASGVAIMIKSADRAEPFLCGVLDAAHVRALAAWFGKWLHASARTRVEMQQTVGTVEIAAYSADHVWVNQESAHIASVAGVFLDHGAALRLFAWLTDLLAHDRILSGRLTQIQGEKP